MEVLAQKIKNFGKNRLKKVISTSIVKDVLTINVEFLEEIDRKRLKTLYKGLYSEEKENIITISKKKLGKSK